MTLEVAQSGLPVLPAESLLHIAMETLQDPQEYCIPWQIPPRYPSPTSWDRKSHHKSKYPSGPVKFTCCPGNFEKGQLTFQSQPCFLNEWTTSLVNLYEVVSHLNLVNHWRSPKPFSGGGRDHLESTGFCHESQYSSTTGMWKDQRHKAATSLLTLMNVYKT